MKISKSQKSPAQLAWKEARHDERWEGYELKCLIAFSHPMTMLPSQITHLKKTHTENAQV